MKKYLLLAFSIILSLYLIYKVQHHAYTYASLVMLLACFISLFIYKKEKSRLIIIYLGSFIMVFLFGEIYFSSKAAANREYQLNYGDEVHVSNEYIGLTPAKNSQRTFTFTYEDSLIYQVTETIDQHGRRIVPQLSAKNGKAVFFFGCSFTFGMGVDDHEAMPYQFQQGVASNYQAFNFGYNAYGAHQMLAILENGQEKAGLGNYKPSFAFYQGIMDHVYRGTTADREYLGPKYRLNEKKQLERVGSLVSPTSNKINYYFNKSKLISRLLIRWQQSLTATEDDIDLWMTMVEKSANIFEERYGGEFYCLLWNELRADKGLYESILKELKERKIKVIEVEEIIPGYTKDYDHYLIFKDGHPKANAHQAIGKYLADFLNKKNKELATEQ